MESNNLISYINVITLLKSHDLSVLYNPWVRPTIEYGYVLCSGAAPSHLHIYIVSMLYRHALNIMSSSIFPSLCNHTNAAIMGLVCQLLAGEGQGKFGNLLTLCPKFITTTARRSQRLQ